MQRYLVHFGVVVVVLLLCGLRTAKAGPIQVEMTNTNGTVPGTSITYTIGILGDDGGLRNIFPAASSDHNVWQWQGPNPNFPEFLSFGQPETLTVSFSAPIEVSHVVLGILSTSASTSLFSVGGGTATAGSFDLSDSLQVYTGATGAALYDGSSGIISASGQNQSLMLGSTSNATMTSFTLAAGASDGGADGYTVFFGFTQPSPASVPEPASLSMLCIGVTGVWYASRRWKQRV